MVVDETCRGRGLGALLVAAAEAWAREQRLSALRVRSNVLRERTHSFYKAQGFSIDKSQVVFRKSLERV